MRNIYCTRGRHYVPSALIKDMAAAKRICLDCDARRIAHPTPSIPKATLDHPALPDRRFRMIAQ